MATYATAVVVPGSLITAEEEVAAWSVCGCDKPKDPGSTLTIGH